MSNTSNLNLERPDKGADEWHTSLNSNMTKLDTGYGNNVATIADLPQMYIETGTLNYTTGDTITLPVAVDAINEYSVEITATTGAGTDPVFIWVEKGTTNFVVKCTGDNHTDTFDATIYYIGDIASYGGSIYRRWYVSPDAGIADHGDTAETGSFAWVLDQIGATLATVELPGNKTYTITTATIVPSNINIIPQRGAVFDGAGTLTINGTIGVGRYQIFGSSITVVTSSTGRQKIAYPEWWGENTAPGTTDMTVEIQAAIDFCESGKDGYHMSPDVDLASTTYFVSATLTNDASGVSIGCNSGGMATLLRSGNYGGTLEINPSGAALIYHTKVHHTAFIQKTNAPVVGDTHLLIEACALFSITDCYFEQGFKNIVIKGSVKGNLERLTAGGVSLLATYETGAGHLEITESGTSPNINANLKISDCDFTASETLRANTFYGYVLLIRSCDGLWFTNSHFHKSANIGVYFTPYDAGSQITSVKFSNCYIDAQGDGTAGRGVGVSFNGTGTGGLHTIAFDNCEIYDSYGDGDSSHGVVFNTGAVYENIKFSNCMVAYWGRHGFNLAAIGCVGIDINNCTIYNNDLEGADYDGIYIVTGTTRIKINDNIIGSETTGNNTQQYGIYGQGTLADSTITGNLMQGNGIEQIKFAGAVTTSVVKDNEPTTEILTGTVTVNPLLESATIYSNGGAVTATLGSGIYIGQIKTIVMTEATASSTVTFTNMSETVGEPELVNGTGDDGEIATFNAVDETWVGIWTGTEWMTLRATCTFV